MSKLFTKIITVLCIVFLICLAGVSMADQTPVMPDVKKEQERDELYCAIRAIAYELRSSVDGWDFKKRHTKNGGC